ncbi:MAG: DUF3850 domain-containing protein [Lachnospiraceae bacterium]|nr:DUF3850 domain-containing protein [Lachnospiraceae bacterium]
MNQIHELKILPEDFEAVIDGRKKFVLYKADKDFSAGDILDLREYNTKMCAYTGRRVLCLVTYIEHTCVFWSEHLILSIDAFAECEVIGL